MLQNSTKLQKKKNTTIKILHLIKYFISNFTFKSKYKHMKLPPQIHSPNSDVCHSKLANHRFPIYFDVKKRTNLTLFILCADESMHRQRQTKSYKYTPKEEEEWKK